MKYLIDKEVLNNRLAFFTVPTDIWEAIQHTPTVDAAPVVRCKDCKHHHYSVCEIPYCDRIDYGYGWKDEDFCSAGERKDGDHHDD